MKNFSLDDIRKAAEAKYGSMSVDLEDGKSVILLNPLRLSTEKRTELSKLQDVINDGTPEEQEEGLRDALTLVAKTEGGARMLLDAFGGDLALLATVFEAYADNAQAGEASGSQD